MNTTAFAAFFSKPARTALRSASPQWANTSMKSRRNRDPLQQMDQWLEEFLHMFQI